MTWEFLEITIGPEVHLVGPVDDAEDVHAANILLAQITGLGEEEEVESTRLYINGSKVYDGAPVLAWVVGDYCEPDTEYDWKVIAVIDDIEYESETWTFTTAEKADVGKGRINFWQFGGPYDVYFGLTGFETLVSIEQTDWFWNLADWIDSDFPEGPRPKLEYNKEYTWWVNDEEHQSFWTMPFYIPQDRVTFKRLVAAAANKIWYEDV